VTALETFAVAILATSLLHVVLGGCVFSASLLAAWRARLHTQSEDEEEEVVVVPRLAVPVTVLATSGAEGRVTRESIASLLAQSYPVSEVVVVTDAGSGPDGAWLRDEIAQEPCRRLGRGSSSEAVTRSIRRSRDQRLFLVDGVGGTRADRLNAGVAFARHPYVCCVDTDTFYRSDALTRAMAAAARSPERIVGVLACVTPSLAAWGSFRHIDEARARLSDRLCWDRRVALPCRIGTFALFRRDMLEKEGGFRGNTEEVMVEMVGRAQRHGRLIEISGSVGKREALRDPETAATRRARWRQAVRRHIQPESAGGLLPGLDTLAEATGPILEVLGLVALCILASWRTLTPGLTAAALSLLVFPPAFFAVVALALQDLQHRPHSWGRLVWLLLLTPFESLLHRPRAAVALLNSPRR
jgi:hypothetical protein